ncbi:Mg2+ transporter protein CorA-like/Zinc transport protein ZntB [Penicillium capsulatum]|uniref:Mg2+ transporter protein CorA-like/Zinc transport protein ZntB n=1 Tax=Penicillium capsulatum TaxID=69766 RepID=A0A9W9HSK3_9EURO|nr:Mg2+ transporter protein CorA-like/Zinc transport protein ZntB [Penicillium capsulatum]KAJ6106869.1 Mg2+ transporter protein CorA-like/Zinc transport protein ZntB [Penicillium capsulatum]
MNCKLIQIDTWAYFEVKQLQDTCAYFEAEQLEEMKYTWHKVNIFTRWFPSTNQTVIFLFDMKPPLTEAIPALFETLEPEKLINPFWVYPHLLEGIVNLEDASVWAIRDQVRAIEKADAAKLSRGQPSPTYRRIHNIARHAIHVTETLDVHAQNVEHALRQHANYAAVNAKDEYAAVNQDIQSQLEVLHSYIASMRHRSISNEKRLQNEIQLAFNNVAQQNAEVSVKIGHVALSDSAAMRTVAFVTLAFLPPTFISSIFSMSFFDYDANSGWSVSGKVWIYFVVAVPIAFATVYLWSHWQKLFPGHQRVGKVGNEHPKESV